MPQITSTSPFNIGQYGIGQIPTLGMGFGQFNPMQNVGLWSGQYGMPGMGLGQGMLGQNLGFGQMLGQMPNVFDPARSLGIGTSPSLGIGQNIPGMSPYSLFGGGGLFGNLGGLFGGFGQGWQNPFGGLFGGGINPFNIPSFTVHSTAVISPTIDPVAQLIKHIITQGILNPYDTYGPFNPLAQIGLGQQYGQFGQLNPFTFGAQQFMQPGINPYQVGRQVVRAYVQTMMGLVPVELYA